MLKTACFNAFPFSFFVCIQYVMVRFAPSHKGEGDGEQEGTFNPACPVLRFRFSKNILVQTKMSRLPVAIGTKKKMYVGNLPLLVFFLVKQQSIFGIHWRYYRLARFLFQFHAGIAGNFASFLRDMHVFTKCLRIAIF